MPDSHAGEWNFVAIWEFHVSPQATARFEEAYGNEGVWVRFFRRAEGFVTTELVHDGTQPGRYLTLDFWTSREAYESFRETHVAGYKAIDAECERLTASEMEIGRFDRL